MTLLVEKGTFTKTTSTGTPVDQTVTLSNGSLTPKLIILWTGGQTTNDGTYVDDSRICYGFSDTANDACFCTRVDESAELETNLYRNDSVITIISLTANTEVSRADVLSVGAGNFHLNWSVQTDTTAQVIHYMVVGGTDITNVSVFQTTVGATTTGNKSYNGSGTTFTPDFGLMITGPDGGTAINTLNSSLDNSAFSLGAMKSTTQRWVVWKRDETVGTSDSDMFHSASLVSFQGSNTSGAQVAAADFVSFNSAAGGGITINVTDGYPSASALFMFLLVKGGTWDANTFTQKSGTGTQDVTLSPSNLDPALVFLAGINTATSASVQISSHMSFGASDGTNEGTTFAGSTSDLATYETATSNLNTKVYRISTPAATASSSTTNAEADMSDMATAGKFTLDWTTADSTQRQMAYWALGSPGSSNLTRSLTTETVSSSESLTRLLAANRALSTETTSSGESIARSVGRNRALGTETVNTSESMAIRQTLTRNPQESTTIGETLNRMLAANRSLSTENITVGESLTRIKGLVRVLATETVTVDESLTRMLAAIRALPETTVIGESLSRLLAATRTLSDTTAISENLAQVKIIIRALATETVTIGENLTRLLTASRTNIENTSIGESLTRLLAATRILGDTTTVGESLNRTIGKIRALATETVVIGESLLRLLSANRTLSDTVVLGDSLTRLQTLIRSLSDTTVIGEQLTRLLAATRTLSDTTVIGESLTKIKGLLRTLSDTTVIGDNLTKILTLTRAIVETTIITDSLVYLRVQLTVPTQVKSIVQWLRSKYSISTPPKDPSY